MKREWAERFTSEKLRQMLADDEVHGGQATAAREACDAEVRTSVTTHCGH